MENYDYIPTDFQPEGTLYSSICPQKEDHFVSVDTYQRGARGETQILQSLVATKDQTGSAADFAGKYGRASEVELQDMILRTRTHVVPDLVKKRNIVDLAKLLVCSDKPFRIFVLKKLKCVISSLDISALFMGDVKTCLQSLINIFPDKNVDDDISIWLDLCQPVMDIVSVLMLLSCSRRNEQTTIKTNMRSLLNTMTDKISLVLSAKKMKKEQPKCYYALKCVGSFIKFVSPWNLSRDVQGIFENWEDAFCSRHHVEHLEKIVEGSFFEQYVVMIGFHIKLKNNIPVEDQFVRFLQRLFLPKSLEKMQTDVHQHALADIALRGIGSCLYRFRGKTEDLMKVVEVCWKQLEGRKGFLPLPYELTDHLFQGDKQLAHTVIQCLNISEQFLLECAEKYIERRVPDIVFYNIKKHAFPKMGDHSYWSVGQGRIRRCDTTIAIHVPGVSPSKLQVTQGRDIHNEMLENDFKILVGLQQKNTHANIVRLLAYSELQSPLPFYAKDCDRMGILDKLMETRQQNKILPIKWFNDRLTEMISALSYLHSQKIVHRDVTLRSFRLIQCRDRDDDLALMYDFNLACQTDFSATAIGQVADLQGDGIPIRWSAIESILQGSYNAKSDIWMFGHVINEIFTYGCEPFTDHYSLTTDDIIAGVLAGDISPQWWPCIPRGYHDLSVSCWKADSSERPSAEDIFETLRKLGKDCREENSDCSVLPRISERQAERNHEPERGISLFIKTVKRHSLERRENVRKSVMGIKRVNSMGPKEMVANLDVNDVASPLQSDVMETTRNILVTEQVTEGFCEKFYTSLTPDFCEKMGIVKDSLSRDRGTVKGLATGVVLKYEYPKAVNILKLARESVSPRHCTDILLSVVQLVQRMHTKRWLMVALTGRNVYVQEQAGQYKAFFVKIGDMVRMSRKPNSSDENIIVSEKFEDLVFWLPREVISFGHLSRGSDVYTMAMLFYQVYMAFSGHSDLQTVPFARRHKSCILGILNEGHKPEKPSKCPPWLYDDVMIPCWHSDRSQRPSVEEILRIMSQRKNENADLLVSSSRDGRCPNPTGLTLTDPIDGTENEDNQYDDIANVKPPSGLHDTEVQNPSQSFIVDEKDMKNFEVGDSHNVTTGSTSFVSPPPRQDESVPNLQIRPGQSPLLVKQTQPIVPQAGQENEKQNPLYESVSSTCKSSSRSESDAGNQEQNITQENLEQSQDSVIRSSDFVQSNS